MRFEPRHSSPHLAPVGNVGRLMFAVVAALVPGTAAAAWFFGPGVLINMAWCAATALAAEAAVLRLRQRPVRPALADGSALVTALLLGLALPPLAPWWLPVIGAAFAIVVAKHLYGGLGYNPFNPAMAGYALLLVSFPREMVAWLPPGDGGLDLSAVLHYSLAGTLPPGATLDALTQATPLDTLRTQIGLGRPVAEAMASRPDLFARVGGVGWVWINGLFLLGGLWLLWRRIAAWQIPAAMLGALGLLALVFWLLDPARHAPPLFHLFSGATMLGAFFIATDPVTASTTPRGRLVYGAGIGVLIYVIRTWGGYPDGVAFAVLLMNMAVPTIDYYTRPRVFGEEKGR